MSPCRWQEPTEGQGGAHCGTAEQTTTGHTPPCAPAHGDSEGFLEGSVPAQGEVAAAGGAGTGGCPGAPPALRPQHHAACGRPEDRRADAAAAPWAENRHICLLRSVAKQSQAGRKQRAGERLPEKANCPGGSTASSFHCFYLACLQTSLLAEFPHQVSAEDWKEPYLNCCSNSIFPLQGRVREGLPQGCLSGLLPPGLPGETLGAAAPRAGSQRPLPSAISSRNRLFRQHELLVLRWENAASQAAQTRPRACV